MKQIFNFLLLSILSGCFGKSPEKTGLEGTPLPSFKLFLVDSTTYFDTKNIAIGKPVVLLFIGPHCPFSRAQVEEITSHSEDLKNIQIYLFTTWPFKDLKKFYAEHHLQDYPTIVAGVDYKNFFANYIGAPGVPFLVIYGKDKKLRQAFVGKIESKQIKSIAIDN